MGSHDPDTTRRVMNLEPPGGRAPLHLHPKDDEAFYVLEGEMTFRIGEETIKTRPGSFVFGPKDVPPRLHRQLGTSEALVHPLACGLRGVHLRTSEPAEPPPEGPPSEAEMEQLGAVARQYGCELLV